MSAEGPALGHSAAGLRPCRWMRLAARSKRSSRVPPAGRGSGARTLASRDPRPRPIPPLPLQSVTSAAPSAPAPRHPQKFSEAIHARFPGKLLAYNCSPSFNWKKRLTDAQIASFQQDLAHLGGSMGWARSAVGRGFGSRAEGGWAAGSFVERASNARPWAHASGCVQAVCRGGRLARHPMLGHGGWSRNACPGKEDRAPGPGATTRPPFEFQTPQATSSSS